jgi:hypothetical protein
MALSTKSVGAVHFFHYFYLSVKRGYLWNQHDETFSIPLSHYFYIYELSITENLLKIPPLHQGDRAFSCSSPARQFRLFFCLHRGTFNLTILRVLVMIRLSSLLQVRILLLYRLRVITRTYVSTGRKNVTPLILRLDL